MSLLYEAAESEKPGGTARSSSVLAGLEEEDLKESETVVV